MRPRSRLISKQSERYLERKKTRFFIIVALSIVSAGTLLFSASRLTGLSIFSIQTVIVKGVDPDIQNGLEAAAYRSLEGDYLGLFSRSNAFIYPKADVERAIQDASVRVKSVKVSNGGGGQLVVTVTEKDPAALVCVGLPDFSSEQDECYFADATGLLYKAAPTFSSSVYKKYFAPNILPENASSSEPIGLLATSTPEFTDLQSFYDAVLHAGIEAEAILIKESGEYELYARNPLPSGNASSSDSALTVIYFNNSRPFVEEAANLVSFWKSMIDGARSRHESLEYEYIDVRYGSNVFYRLIK